MAIDVGSNAVVSAGGVVMPAILSNTGPALKRAMQEILIANGGAPMIGHAPSTGAESGFNLGFRIPKAGAAAFLNGLLNTAGVTVGISYGTAGGVSTVTSLLKTLTVQGNEGNALEGSASFESIAKPTAGFSASAGTFTDGVFTFADVVSFTGVAGVVRTDVSAFSFTVNRKNAAFRGNSKTGIPKHLKFSYDGSLMMAKYLRADDSEFSAAIADCPTTGDCTVSIIDACGTDALTFVVHAGFYDETPTTNGDVTAFIEETATATANLGAYAIS